MTCLSVHCYVQCPNYFFQLSRVNRGLTYAMRRNIFQKVTQKIAAKMFMR